METWDAITTRRNIRQYRNEPVPSEDLDRILDAGRRSPSGSNKQRWDFVLVTDRDRLQRLSKTWPGAGHIAGAAAAIVLIAPETEDRETWATIQYDLGQATMTMMLMATDLGVASAHANVEDQDMARDILGMPPDQHCSRMIGLGLPHQPLTPVQHDRRPFDDVVHRETW